MNVFIFFIIYIEKKNIKSMCLPLSFVKLLVRWAAGLTIVIGCSIAIAASINLVMAQSEDNVVN